MAGKKSIYISFFCKSDVSGTNNVPTALGVITGATPLYFRHNIDVADVPNAWAWGYIFSDRSVRFETKANTGSNNKLQHIACQIQAGVAPRMWIDGVEQVAARITQEPTGTGYPTGGLFINPTNDHLMIGRGSVNSRLWDGLVDEVRIIEDVKDSAYVAIEYANLTNIDDFIISGDVETPITKQSPIGELLIIAAPTLATTRIRVDRYVTNPNSDPLLITNVSTPNIGTAVKVNDSFVDYTAPSGAGRARFDVTFSSGGKTVIVPIIINVAVGGVPPDITDIALLADRVSWSTYVEPAGFQGYQPKESPSDAGTWADSTNVGALTPNKFVLKTALKAASRKVLVKPFANGRESINAAEISLIDIPSGVNYWNSPNYGGKTRENVGNREQLLNAIAGINTANAYINMTYRDGVATTINRGGTATHPLIISADAPNGLTNFTGRGGFNARVILNADYVWLDRLWLKTGEEGCVDIRNSWKFVTRCLIETNGDGVHANYDVKANEFWVGFNKFIGQARTRSGYIHIDARGTGGTSRPKRARIYYNTMVDNSPSITEDYGIHTGPGSAQGDPDKDYPGFNVDGSWAHYNLIDTNRWGVYMKHGMDMEYNHVAGSNVHGISTRGHCVSRCKINFNRITSGQQISLQGWHHEAIGNISNDFLKLGHEFKNSPGEGKITRGSMYSVVALNQCGLILGESRSFNDPDNPITYAPLHDVLIEKHIGKYYRWVSDSSRTEITLDANNKFPIAPVVPGTNPNNHRFYDRDRIVTRSTTTRVAKPVPTLNTSNTGPGASGGKVWGT
jgi:hypothetical protein